MSATPRPRRLPFDPLVPNATTVAAMEAARHGELETARLIDDVFEQLDHDDGAEQPSIRPMDPTIQARLPAGAERPAPEHHSA